MQMTTSARLWSPTDKMAWSTAKPECRCGSKYDMAGPPAPHGGRRSQPMRPKQPTATPAADASAVQRKPPGLLSLTAT